MIGSAARHGSTPVTLVMPGAMDLLLEPGMAG